MWIKSDSWQSDYRNISYIFRHLNFMKYFSFNLTKSICIPVVVLERQTVNPFAWDDLVLANHTMAEYELRGDPYMQKSG